MERRKLELALVYGNYDLVKCYTFDDEKSMKEKLDKVLASEDMEINKIEISILLVDDDMDDNLTSDIVCEIDYQQYIELKEIFGGE